MKNSKEVRFSQIDYINELFKSGVTIGKTLYEKEYHDYWNPIMEEHQKKADEMK